MPDYDFRCEDCGRHATLHWRSGSEALARQIHAVGIARGERNYASMSSADMLSVLEGEDSGEVQELHRQVHEGDES